MLRFWMLFGMGCLLGGTPQRCSIADGGALAAGGADSDYAVVWFRWPECETCSRALDAAGVIMRAGDSRVEGEQVAFSDRPWQTVGVFRSSSDLLYHASDLALERVHFVEYRFDSAGVSECEGRTLPITTVLELMPRRDGLTNECTSVRPGDELPRTYRMCVAPTDFAGSVRFALLYRLSWQWILDVNLEPDLFTHLVVDRSEIDALARDERCLGVVSFETACQ